MFWFYIKDRCDHAGFWRPNFKNFEIMTGHRINQKEFLSKVNTESERIKILENGRWWLTGFIKFHFRGVLNLNNHFHKSVYLLFMENINCENTTAYGFEVKQKDARPHTTQETGNREQYVLSVSSQRSSSLVLSSSSGNNPPLAPAAFETAKSTYPANNGAGSPEVEKYLRLKEIEEPEVIPKILASIVDYNDYCRRAYPDTYPNDQHIKRARNWLWDKDYEIDWSKKIGQERNFSSGARIQKSINPLGYSHCKKCGGLHESVECPK